jgi:hypothetical protein
MQFMTGAAFDISGGRASSDGLEADEIRRRAAEYLRDGATFRKFYSCALRMRELWS